MDTSSNCFVFASAGSGKTKILVDRFIKHMVFGCHVRDIMCVTFTNAAAFEMETRIESILKKFENMEEKDLNQYLKEVLLIPYFNQKHVKRARQLYSEWLDNYSFLSIGTIHSFCQKILEQYPIESGIMSDFEILDDFESQELLALAKNNFLKKVIHSSDSSVSELAKLLSGYSFEDLLNKIFSSFSKFRRFINNNKSIEEYEHRLNRIFRVGKLRDLPSIFGDVQEDRFLTKTGEIRKKIKIPGFSDDKIKEISEIFFENRNITNKQRTISKTISFIKVAKQILDEYQLLKKERNVLDFTDIIHKTEFLLMKSESSAFVISQISKTIKHMMVDESQDLNADQWNIISLIFDEVFVTSSEVNTIFIVGDIKQSIYGFQDANPDNFMAFYERCGDILYKIGRELKTVYLKNCYRCTPEILTLIDEVFKDMHHYDEHIPFRGERGTAETVPIKNLADDVPVFIKKLISEKNIEPSDIMILTKNRNVINDLVKNIYEADLKTSGLDKINSDDSLVIMDIIALAEFCIDRSNDYALVCFLKSPNVFENPLKDHEIYDICHGRDKSVFDIISSDSMYSEYVKVIEDVINHFETCDLLEFFYFLSKEIVRCHNEEERNVSVSFLNIVSKRYEKQVESVENFVIWFKTHDIQFQKEYNKEDGIKFSTIHGSKGLESPVVILIDFSLEPEKAKTKFVWQELYNPYDIFFVTKPSDKESFPEIRPMVDVYYNAEKMENFRLLYVALTRARDRLYIFGPCFSDGAFDFICEKIYVN